MKTRISLVTLCAALVGCLPHKGLEGKATLDQELIVNLNPEHYIVTSLDRYNGEEQLRFLAETSSVEEEWAYLEEGPKSEKQTTWYEIGINEKLASVTINYKGLLGMVLFELAYNPSAKTSTYHIHPSQAVESALLAGTTSFPTYPSKPDIASIHTICADILLFTLNSDALHNYDARIVDHNGLYVIGFDTKNFRKVSSEESYEQLVALYQTEDLHCPYTFPLEKSKENDEKAIACSKSFAQRLDATASFTAVFYSWDEHKKMREVAE